MLDFFGHIWTQGTLRYIIGPILVIFEICHFLMTPGLFEYFCPQSHFTQKWINGWPTPGYSDLVLGGQVPRLNHGPI